MPSTTTTVRRAAPNEADVVTEILATGFMDDPVSGWIFPSPAQRADLHPVFFRPFVDMTLTAGEVYLAIDPHGEGIGTTLWLPIDVTAELEPEQILGSNLPPDCAQRFAALDKLMQNNHPHDQSHSYLPFIAVRPSRQGKGVGATMLTDRLRDLDRTATPAYLEASSARNARLYRALGFLPLATTLDLHGGPTLQPMWRDAT